MMKFLKWWQELKIADGGIFLHVIARAWHMDLTEKKYILILTYLKATKKRSDVT